MKPVRFWCSLFVVTFAAFALCGFSLAVVPAFAQTPTVATPPSAHTTQATRTVDQIRSLIETLEDEASRKRLVEQLKVMLAAAPQPKAPAAPRPGARLIDITSERIAGLSAGIAGATASLAGAPNLADWFGRQFGEEDRRQFWIRLVWKVVLVLLVGFVAQTIVRVALRRPRRAVESRSDESFTLRSLLLVSRTILDVMPLAAFAAMAYVVLPMVDPDRPTRLAVLTFVNASVIARAITATALAVLAPRVPSLRLFAVPDETANYFYVWTRRFANVAVYGYFLAELVLLLGAPQGGYHLLRLVVGFLVALLAIVFVLQNRDGVAAWIGGEPEALSKGAGSVLRRRIGDIWHILAIVYVVAAFVVWSLDIENGSALVMRGTILSLVVLALVGLLSHGVTRLVERALSIGKEMSDRFPGLETRANRYLGVVYHTLRGAIFLAGGLAILEAWGVDSFGWIATDAGRRVIETIVIIALMLVVSVLVWELVNSAVERYLSAGSDGAAEVSARALTLLPLVRSVTAIVLVTLVVLVALSELGVNIGPLLAGAGVVGLAVGFGAQTLVKDIITGFFILSENQMAVGDVVRAGSHAGLVEGLTIRTLRLRDLAGNVHIIPFSAVTTVENMTKEFSRYVFDVGVAYREDTDEVVEVLKAIGEEMVADPYFGALIVAPLEILGVDRFADSAVIVRARFTTKPIKQWEVGREFNRRMKKRFDELGIEIPFPHRTVYFGIDKSGEAPAAHVRVDGEKGAPSRQVDWLGNKS